MSTFSDVVARIRANWQGVQQYRTLVAAYFPANQVDNALAVIAAESGGVLTSSTKANNPAGSEDSRGLFQINVQPGAHPLLANLNLYDAVTNIQQAAIIYQSSGWYPWTTAVAIGLPVEDTPGAFLSKILENVSEGVGDTLGNIGKGVGDTLGNTGDTIGGIVEDVTSLPKTISAWSTWLAQPHLWIRVLLTVAGMSIVIVGIGLLAFSITPDNVKADVKAVAKAAV